MMDDEPMNIKNIIEPYEKRIKDLEDIIRNKDFEIAILKQQLFNINKNQNKNSNGFLNDKENEKINIKFIFPNNTETIMKCYKYEKIKRVYEKYGYLHNCFNEIRNVKLTCDNRLLRPYLSFSQNNIVNDSVIRIETKDPVNLIFERNGTPFAMAFDKNMSVGMALVFYLIEIEDEKSLLHLINNINSIDFLYNMNKYTIKDFTSIKNIFNNGARILVIENNNIMEKEEVREMNKYISKKQEESAEYKQKIDEEYNKYLKRLKVLLIADDNVFNKYSNECLDNMIRIYPNRKETIYYKNLRGK